MKREHQNFIKALLKTGDRKTAYKKAYPHASGEALRTSADRLYKKLQPAIQDRLDITAQRIKEEDAALAHDRLKTEKLNTDERRSAIAYMVRGNWKITKHLKFKDRLEEVEDSINPFALLRAIELDAKLEAGYPMTRTQAKEQKKPEMKVKGHHINIPGINPPLMELYFEAQNKWKELNPDKFTEEIEQLGEKVSACYIDYKEERPFPELTQSREKELQQKQREQFEAYLRSVVPGWVNKHFKDDTNTTGSDSVTNTYPKPVQVAEQQTAAKTITLPQKTENEGYVLLDEELMRGWQTSISKRSAATEQAYFDILKVSTYRNAPPDKKAMVEQKTGWEYHPTDKRYVRKRAA